MVSSSQSRVAACSPGAECSRPHHECGLSVANRGVHDKRQPLWCTMRRRSTTLEVEEDALRQLEALGWRRATLPKGRFPRLFAGGDINPRPASASRNVTQCVGLRQHRGSLRRPEGIIW
jgi:hypothetical protein